jgi:glycine/D-amino acid oxidase-like deaminating enzyme
MLEKIRDAKGRRLSAEVRSIDRGHEYVVEIEGAGGTQGIAADVIVNAAGPFAAKLAAMIDIELPVENFYHQKIAFNDNQAVIPRQLPFSCDLDDVAFDWSDEDRSLLAEDAETAWLTRKLPGGAHCRPEGGDNSSWIKLGWAYNQNSSEAQEDLANEPLKNPQFPEIVMRAAARLNPSLQVYVDNFPSQFVHYGGYYPMTRENWPLVGPLGFEGSYVVGALSGFGSMSACAAGALCAAWITGDELPGYADQLSMARYGDKDLMAELENAQSLGIL